MLLGFSVEIASGAILKTHSWKEVFYIDSKSFETVYDNSRFSAVGSFFLVTYLTWDYLGLCFGLLA
jgi:hypothetical protein